MKSQVDSILVSEKGQSTLIHIGVCPYLALRGFQLSTQKRDVYRDKPQIFGLVPDSHNN